MRASAMKRNHCKIYFHLICDGGLVNDIVTSCPMHLYTIVDTTRLEFICDSGMAQPTFFLTHNVK